MEQTEVIKERYDLAIERINRIIEEKTVPETYQIYFSETADFIVETDILRQRVTSGELRNLPLDELRQLNVRLYQDIRPESYHHSFGNPDYAVSCLGEEYGKLLSYLYTELRGMICYAYEERVFDMVIAMELFIEIYNYFEQEQLPAVKVITEAIYWYISDYSDIILDYQFRQKIDPDLTFYTDIIMNSDLNDLRYLYFYGRYISDNEIKTALYLNSLPQEEIEKMAFTFVNGYVKGFEAARIDLSGKKTVAIRTYIGFERMMRAAVKQFRSIGLEPVFGSVSGTSPNNQFDHDHRFDHSLYVDKALNDRKLSVLKVVYEKYKTLAGVYAGPACLEVFGEEPFSPETKQFNCKLSPKQQKLMVDYNNQSAMLSNEYMNRANISFTIIAYPIAEIGDNYEEIFTEIVKVNTLDSQLYSDIQQRLIDALDQAEYVRVKGCQKNKTDLRISLKPLKDSQKETKFENCVADVNIPVGEVFTSPVLEGTNGILNVSKVYLNDYSYSNLTVEFKDGMISDYSCNNFESEEENKKYIKDNVLVSHESLPMGEFAIGTNTTAYVMAEKYNIMEKLPILIVEKMGPHFAVGDTCYSRSEENRLYNPDGKEIIAKDNTVSALRETAPDKAYFNCHTDITIPYREIGEITAVKKDGGEICIIREGRFCLPGTEKLNEVFEHYE